MTNEKITIQGNPQSQHRQRLLDALEHRESDRIPLTLGSPSCSLHRIAQENLLQYLNLEQEKSPLITDNILQIIETDMRLIDLFDIDLLWLLPKEPPVALEAELQGFTDSFGRKFIAGGGFYNQIGHPLKEHSMEELKTFKFPDLLAYDRFSYMETQGHDLYENGYALGVDGPWGIYEISSSLVGTEDYLMDLVLRPDYARQVAETVLEKHHLPFYENLLSRTAPFIHVVGISDDLGSQNNLIFSKKVFQEVFKPLLQELIAHIHRFSDAKVYMHSDGSIYPIIPDLIEIGVDGLNPLQYTAKDMDLARLKNEFGKDLGFFGGVIENMALSFSSPEQVRQLVRENVSILKEGGGFIFAPIHNISQEVSPENILALYHSGLEFGKF